jgi:hypothetical protein
MRELVDLSGGEVVDLLAGSIPVASQIFFRAGSAQPIDIG